MSMAMVEEIKRLKREKKALVLAHHYQEREIKEVADFVGDSLELARIAANSSEPILVVCGVSFMAETAKILSPDKKVLLPNVMAGCPMADMVTVERLREEKARFPQAKVVCYVNSSAAVKAESDICCTSSNAVSIVKGLPDQEILFVPDQNLGSYVALSVPEKTVHLWKGFCPTHHRVEVEAVKVMKAAYPNAKVMAHPECRPEILEAVDFIGSTAQLVQYAKAASNQSFIVGTEKGILDILKSDSPQKSFELLSEELVCPNMKKTTLMDVLKVLQTGANQVEIESEVREKAYVAIQRMLDVSK